MGNLFLLRRRGFLSIFKNQGGVNFKTYVNYLNTRGDFLSIAKNWGEVNFNVARLLINFIKTRKVFFCEFFKNQSEVNINVAYVAISNFYKSRRSQLQCMLQGFLSISKNRGEAFCQFLKTKARLFVRNLKWGETICQFL